MQTVSIIPGGIDVPMSTAPMSDLTINLPALEHNWVAIKSRLGAQVDCGAVLKANAYGVGVEPVLARLLKAGCRTFYVANLDEACTVKKLLAHSFSCVGLEPSAVTVVVLSGCAPGDELTFIEQQFMPVLISREMFLRWESVVARAGLRPGSVRSALKLDTGMLRLGLDMPEFDELLSRPESLRAAGMIMLMSHLACADVPADPLNMQQRDRFALALDRLQKVVPQAQGSLANSAGVLLGSRFHFGAVRPGIALYGGNPQPGVEAQNPFKPVVHLRLPVIQVRELTDGGMVGYGATARVSRGARLAVLAGGYADGVMRALSNGGEGWVSDGAGSGWVVPICGRISMDSTVIDISRLPAGVIQVGGRVELLGKHIAVEDVAQKAGTISYEIFTSLGQRYQRTYIE